MTALNVSNIDFFETKENIKTYLKSKPKFTDYDFDGSALSVLIDVLAYIHHMTGTYTNFAFAESFLDSAVKRGSVVSRASEINYIPRSRTASTAQVNLSFTIASGPSQVVLPKGTTFYSKSADVNGFSYPFVTIEDILINNDGSDTYTKTITIYQGKLSQYSYTVDLSNSNQKIIIPSMNVDNTTLTVEYKENSSSTKSSVFRYFSDIEEIGSITGDTPVYFMKENQEGYFELYFGDGIVGKNIETGNIITLQYLITNGEDANNIKTFVSESFPISGATSVTLTTISNASGGKDKESIDSIKYLAPFYYSSQNRAVTETDHTVLMKKEFPYIDDVSVWGGEKNNPPYYGKVFMAVKPAGRNKYFSNTTKENIKRTFQSKYSIMGITPEIVDPDYISVIVNCSVVYKARLNTSTSSQSLQDQVKDKIISFFENNSNRFKNTVYYSQLLSEINNVSPNIITGTNINFKIYKEFSIISSISANYRSGFNNSMEGGSFYTSPFIIGTESYYIKDIPESALSSNGVLNLYVKSNDNLHTSNIGTINYLTGEFSIENLKIDVSTNNQLDNKLYCYMSIGDFQTASNPEIVYKDNNIYTNSQDQIILLDEDNITINMIADESMS